MYNRAISLKAAEMSAPPYQYKSLSTFQLQLHVLDCSNWNFLYIRRVLRTLFTFDMLTLYKWLGVEGPHKEINLGKLYQESDTYS